mgnify:CR=1 FL=1
MKRLRVSKDGNRPRRLQPQCNRPAPAAGGQRRPPAGVGPAGGGAGIGKGNGPGAFGLEKKPANLGARIKETGETDGELFWKISEGHGFMVRWKVTPLSETQRWELVNYIRATFAK